MPKLLLVAISVGLPNWWKYLKTWLSNHFSDFQYNSFDLCLKNCGPWRPTAGSRAVSMRDRRRQRGWQTDTQSIHYMTTIMAASVFVYVCVCVTDYYFMQRTAYYCRRQRISSTTCKSKTCSAQHITQLMNRTVNEISTCNCFLCVTAYML